MTKVLVLALALGLLAPSAIAPPTTNERFQGHGTTWNTDVCFEYFVVLEQVDGLWFATLFSTCTVFLPFTAGGIVFRMSGSWEEGWTGKPLVNRFGSWLNLGPYGDGTAITIDACLLCDLDDFWILGTLRDLHVA